MPVPETASNTIQRELDLEPADAARLSALCGQLNEHLKQIESRLGVRISNRGNHFSVDGPLAAVESTVVLLERLYQETAEPGKLGPEEIHLHLQSAGPSVKPMKDRALGAPIRTKKVLVKPRGERQTGYVQNIRNADINFGIGPAGTGKTYLAVACAVEAYLQDSVERILLVRPAVEAGERLGFLPGDLAQKVDPYLRPLYDALYEMFGFETVGKLIDRHIIEVAPLAYMRGRTLNHSFIILDESQNTTREQMKMFLTRIGFGSTAVITGDPTQIDLPRGTRSGLIHAIGVLEKVDGIRFTHFTSQDVVRHELVQRIVDAYDLHEKGDNRQSD